MLFGVCCCMLLGVRCVLYVVCVWCVVDLLLFVACCLWFDDCCLLIVS